MTVDELFPVDGKYTLGSLFDGAGGFPLAAQMCGIKPVWASEIEPFPIAVTKARFPNMKHLGDVTKINGAEIEPDIVCDFKDLPFEAETFSLAVFDPPHLIDKKDTAWLVKKYGTLPANWKDELKQGFNECMRVLKHDGVLIFKWNEAEVKTSEIIKTFGVEPLFGHRSGKRMATHWLVYMKE